MTEPNTLEYTVKDTLGVHDAHVRLKPGVNTARGRNGCGKTSTIRSIVRASGGGGELEPRDGTTKGKVLGPGVVVHVGKVTRRTETGDGMAPIALMDPAPVSQLIDPGYKEDGPRNRARLRALTDLTGQQVDEEAVQILAQGDETAAAWLREEVQENALDDLDIAEKKVKAHFEGRARQHEAEAEASEGRAGSARERAASLLEEIGGQGHVVDDSPEDARAALQEGIREHERQLARCEAREALETRQAEIRATMGERPDTAEAQAALEQAQARHQTATDQVAELERKLQAAKAERDAAAEAVEHHSERLEAQTREASRWDEAQAVLARQAEGPTREELAELERTLVREREARLEAAQRSQTYRDAVAEGGAAEEQRRIAAEAGARLRDLAKALPARLGDILAKAGAEGLAIVDGRLHAELDGKLVDFDRLSQGQKVRAAACVMVQVYPAESVVPFGWEEWAALDPENREFLDQEAKRHGLFVLTEEASDGPLRVEPMEAS